MMLGSVIGSLLSLLHLACSPPDMRVELQKLVTEGRPEMYYHWNARRAEMYMAMADTASTEDTQLKWHFLAWNEQLNAGQTEACIKAVSDYLQAQGGISALHLDQGNKALYELLAVAYLRLGEQQNCLANHSAASCIIPFRPEALHQLPTGSTEAIRLYEMILQRFPNDYQARWLYNLAHLTLGAMIPQAYYLPWPDSSRQQMDFPAFANRAMATGTAINGLSGGTCIEDFNHDGYLDIFATAYGMNDQVRLLLNDRQGGFVDATQTSGLEGILGGLNAIHADYDNDGLRDILVLRGGWLTEYGQHPNSLLHNLGDGRFEDVTFAAGLGSRYPTQTAAWADFDQDGWLDLFIGNESGTGQGVFSELYHNNGDGTFSEMAKERGIHVSAIVKGVAWGDINNDGWPDLYVSCLGSTNKLFKNEQGHFRNIALGAGVQNPNFSFPCWFWDYDQDGRDDILVAAYDMRSYTNVAGIFGQELASGTLPGERLHLYHNKGDETFTEVGEALGLNRAMHAMGSNFGDLDNDGYPDFYIGTGAPNLMSVVPNRMFHNLGGKGFVEVTAAGGFGHLQKGHAIAFGDLDLDGDQDIYMVVGGAYEGDVFDNALLENPGFGAHWLALDLIGKSGNRDAIGARLQLELSAGDSSWTLFQTVNTGGSFGSSSLRQEWGIGSATHIRSLTIHWPGAEPQTIRDLVPDQLYRIEEGGVPQTLKLPSISLRQTMPAHSAH